MFSLFALLFQKSYWLMLLRKATWYEAWLSLKRAHKDRRARKHILRFALFLTIPVLCCLYLLWLIGSGAVLLLPFILLAGWFLRRGHNNNDPAKLSIRSAPTPIHRQLTPEERATVRNYLAEQALIHAVLADRAGSEAFLKQKALPEGFEVVSRRTHLDLLKSKGLWDKLPASDREAMMMPDGHWEWPLINQVTLIIEPLRLLRWTLRLDYYLPLIGQQLQLDYRLANELVHAPQKLFEGKDLATADMIETARTSAKTFLIRCHAEEIARGYYQPPEDEPTDWAHEITTNLSGKQHEDLVLGNKLVSETTQDELQWATRLSRIRMNVLSWTLNLIDPPAPSEAPPADAQTTPG